MSKVKVNEIKAAIEALSKDEYVQLRQWFSEMDWERWDRQIELGKTIAATQYLIQISPK